jgi:hypothetical protein
VRSLLDWLFDGSPKKGEALKAQNELLDAIAESQQAHIERAKQVEEDTAASQRLVVAAEALTAIVRARK